MNNSTSFDDDNTTGAEERTRMIFLILSIVVTLTAFILNAGFVIVGIQSLKRTFHNLLILLLCFNDVFISLSVTAFYVSKLTQVYLDSTIVCLVFIMTCSYGLITEHCIVFLLGFARFVTIRYRKLNFTHKLERFKYQIFFMVHLSCLSLIVVTSVSSQDAATIQSCNTVELFGKYYHIFILVVWVPASVIILITSLMYSICSYDLWKMFSKGKAVTRSQYSNSMEMAAKPGLASNKVVPCAIEEINEAVFTDAGTTSRFLAEAQCLDTSRQSKKISVESYPHEMNEVKDFADEEKQLQGEYSPEIKEEETIGKAEMKKYRAKLKMKNKDDVLAIRTFKAGQSKIITLESSCPEMNWVEGSADEHNQIIQLETKEEIVDKDVSDNKVQLQNKCKEDIWEFRAFKANLLVATTTICLTLPFVVTFLYDLFAQDALTDKPRIVAYLMCSINHIFDPFIYAFRVPEIRKEIQKRFSRQ